MQKHTLFLFVAIWAASSLSSSSVRAANPTPAPSSVPEDEAAFRDTQAAFGKGKCDEVLQRAEDFGRRFPKTAQSGAVRNLSGLCLLTAKKFDAAIGEFQKAETEALQPGFRPFLRYNLATALYEAGKIPEAEKVLSQIDAEALDPDNRTKYFALKARVATKAGNPSETARSLLSAARSMNSGPAVAALQPQLSQALAQINDGNTLTALARDFADSAILDAVLFRLAEVEAAAGQNGFAEAHYRAIGARFPNSPLLSDALAKLKGIETLRPSEGLPVLGLLLPKTGRYAKLGNRSAQAVQIALAGEDGASRWTSVWEDAGEEPEQTIKALEKLANEHHVSAVIGPLMSKGIEQITQKAQEIGVPMISLAQRPGQLDGYVFQSALTPQLQTQEIARYAIQKMGLKRIAILAPKDKFGEEHGFAFWDAIEALGGEIVGYETYTPGETDFRQQIDKLAGLYYTEARQDEIDAMAKDREANKITKKSIKTQKYYSLKPLVDFEAVFIPEDPKALGQILPTFAYRDVDGVKFLGIATWNSPELVARARQYAEGTYFVDAFYADSRQPQSQKFSEGYRSTFGQSPSLVEALAYDAALLFSNAAGTAKGLTRSELRDRLKAVDAFTGATGTVKFQDGRFNRELKLLTVKDGKISEPGT